MAQYSSDTEGWTANRSKSSFKFPSEDSDVEVGPLIASTSKRTLSDKTKPRISSASSSSTAAEVIVLSSDSEQETEDGGAARRRRRSSKSPRRATYGQTTQDKVERDLEHIAKVVGRAVPLERIFALYKKNGQDVDATIDKIQSDRKRKEQAAKEREKVDKANEAKAKEKERGKAKAPAKKRDEQAQHNSKKRKQAERDDDDDEVDELVSDPEDDPVAEEGYWLGVDKREEASENADQEVERIYKKAAFFQLCVDWKKVSQSSIRKVFTMCKGFYAPTWLKLHSLKQDELFDLVKISRERDTEWQDKKDKDTGKMVKVKRDAPPTSRKLELEMDWLQKYVDVELTKRKKEQKLARGGHGQAKAPPQKKAKRNDKADPKASGSTKAKSTASRKGKRKAEVNPLLLGDDSDEEEEDQLYEGGGGGGGGAAGWGIQGGALDTANSYSSKKYRDPTAKAARFSVFHAGQRVDRKDREGTVAFSGQGRRLE